MHLGTVETQTEESESAVEFLEPDLLLRVSDDEGKIGGGGYGEHGGGSGSATGSHSSLGDEETEALGSGIEDGANAVRETDTGLASEQNRPDQNHQPAGHATNPSLKPDPYQSTSSQADSRAAPASPSACSSLDGPICDALGS